MPEEIKKESTPEDIFDDTEMAAPQKTIGGQPRIEEIKTIAAKPPKRGFRFQFNSRFLLVPLIIVIVVGLVYGGYALIKNFPIKSKNPKITTTLEQGQTEKGTPIAPIKPKPTNDNDGDGLTNDEEAKLGTDPNSADTDKDGLFDKEEVDVYHTNPLKADTDGDGTSDGVEVKRGEDPNNPAPGAKLLDLQKAISNIK